MGHEGSANAVLIVVKGGTFAFELGYQIKRSDDSFFSWLVLHQINAHFAVTVSHSHMGNHTLDGGRMFILFLQNVTKEGVKIDNFMLT